ncbi:MAG: ABC transporter substrate-binding protein [Alphaproteobacteria bacterium]|nr:ABC transporter substrate-binding protein [Alphaproteobacteria bacterium]
MRRRIFVAGAVAASVLPAIARGQKKYGPGASDGEIKLGQTLPYSGPLSALGLVGKAEQAYFRMLNDQGGINGRKVTLISFDDGYSPPKTVEMTRQLVEKEQVLAIFSTLGTPTNTAIHRYLNQKKVPQLFILSGAAKWNDPANFPWTMMGLTAYRTEAAVYARHILKTRPAAKIAVLIQNDDFGKDYLEGFRKGLGDKAATMIVAEASYESTDPTIESQMIQLQTSGADVLFSIALGKHQSMAIRKAGESWKPTIYFPFGARSIPGVLRPAGVDNARGVMTIAVDKTPGDPQWDDDAQMKAYFAFMKKYLPGENPLDSSASGGYGYAALMAHVLRACGDDLSRENVMRQAAAIKDYVGPLVLPGIVVNTSPQSYLPYRRLRLQQFDGTTYKSLGDVFADE